MTRIYGARAIALGLAYLMAGRPSARLQRLSLGVDVSDTAVGTARLAADLRRHT